MSNNIIILLLIFMGVAFFTIMERKLLGSFHIRMGPNKMGFFGIFQPFSDAAKLFSKDMILISKVNENFWSWSSLMLLMILVLMMMFFPIKMMNNFAFFNMMLITVLIGISIYPMFWTSFFSFSKYSLISSKRAISQMLSYEMGFVFIMMILFVSTKELDLEMLMINLKYNYFTMFFFLNMSFCLILCESSRIPFDFVEGESELVSGFNTEFSSVFFSMFFIYEYGMMLIMSTMFSFLLFEFTFCFLLFYMFILTRSSFPRMRYDQMMNFFWKYYLISILGICILII